MNSYMEKVKNHLSHKEYLSIKDIFEMIILDNSLRYDGIAYRVLVFNNKPKVKYIDISNDKSFSKDLEGISNFLKLKGLKSNKYIIIFKVVIAGLDLEKFILKSMNLNKKLASFEKEVIPFEFLNIEIFKEGYFSDLMK